MARALAALFGAGGGLTLVSLLFPHWPGLVAVGVLAPAVLAVMVSAGLLLAGGRLPVAAFHVLLVLGTACICVAVHFGGSAHIYAAYFVWVSLYGFNFFSRRAGFVHLAIAAAGYLGVLALTPTVALGPTWLVMIGTAAVAGLVISTLVQKVTNLALTDPLTGLANRRAWADALEREVANAARHGSAVCVAMLDLDGLKRINDEWGHHAGDLAIADAAARWSAVVRKGDFLARLGGDEFGLILPRCKCDEAQTLLARMNSVLNDQTVSCGVACLNEGEQLDSLVVRADRALYEAKRGGRSRVVAA